MIMHGVSPVAALISSRVGKRFSANCAQVQPPITCTQCGGGVRRACSPTRRMPSASDGTPSQRTSLVYVSPPRMKWVCASFSPGMTVRRPASMTRVFSSRKVFSSASEPTPTMVSPLIAMAAASGCRGLSVATRPFTISTSAGPACTSGAQPPSAVTPRTAPELRKNCRRPYVICPPRGALAGQPVVHRDVFRLQLDPRGSCLHKEERGEVLLGHAVTDQLLEQVAPQRRERHRNLEAPARVQPQVHVLPEELRRESDVKIEVHQSRRLVARKHGAHHALVQEVEEGMPRHARLLGEDRDLAERLGDDAKHHVVADLHDA